MSTEKQIREELILSVIAGLRNNRRELSREAAWKDEAGYGKSADLAEFEAFVYEEIIDKLLSLLARPPKSDK